MITKGMMKQIETSKYICSR